MNNGGQKQKKGGDEMGDMHSCCLAYCRQTHLINDIPPFGIFIWVVVRVGSFVSPGLGCNYH